MPTAEIRRSAVICCVLPSCSTVAVTLSAPLSTFTTFAPVISLMPWAANCLAAMALISSSSTGRMRSMTSTTVTSAPMLRKNDANSMPMAPEPTTSSDFGSEGGTIASR